MTDRDNETLKEVRNVLGLGETPIIKIRDDKRTPRLIQYDKHVNEAREIFVERNSVYKDTFVHLGLMGTVMTLIGDNFRLRNMIIYEPDHGRSHREQIKDKLLDVINQSVISLMMLEEDNFEGK